MKTLYNTDFITKHLPQKIPFLMIDRVVEYTPQRSIRVLKNVTANENYFQGHFPEKKVMPGVMICEALAQSVSLFNILNQMELRNASWENQTPENGLSKDEIPVLASLNMKFTNIVTPGDQLILKIKPGRKHREMFSFDVEARVDGKIVAKGTQFTSQKKE